MARARRRRTFKRDAKGRFARTGKRLARGTAIAAGAVALAAGGNSVANRVVGRKVARRRAGYRLRGQQAALPPGRKVG